MLIEDECLCGAVFSVAGSFADCATLHGRWITAHRVCRNQAAHDAASAASEDQHSEPGRGECGWSLDDEGYYQTECGTEFVSPDFLTLEEMPSMKYCANCGRRIRDDSPAPGADEREDG